MSLITVSCGACGGVARSRKQAVCIELMSDGNVEFLSACPRPLRTEPSWC